ncbi:hypothetical protein lbkm_3698 [Lachnospiraceae bacterium KM106-2]|nr:hypothetical protein lbkm_3698 [Lachnospiraceae bacterium KM106-2]
MERSYAKSEIEIVPGSETTKDMEQKAYIEIMIQSQKKKILILDKLISLSKDQEEYFSAEEMDYDKFNDTLSTKDELLKELNELDQGFASLFERVKEELSTHKYAYETQIKELQSSIATITSKSMILETLERRNKASMERFSKSQKSQIKQRNVSMKTVTNYYKSMSNEQSVYFNQKK